MNAKLRAGTGTRKIQTVFYFGKQIAKTNRAVHANSAVLRCVDHMQLNTYGANSAEVFDERTGTLHAVIRRPIGSNTITILYKRDVEEGM